MENTVSQGHVSQFPFSAPRPQLVPPVCTSQSSIWGGESLSLLSLHCAYFHSLQVKKLPLLNQEKLPGAAYNLFQRLGVLPWVIVSGRSSWNLLLFWRSTFGLNSYPLLWAIPQTYTGELSTSQGFLTSPLVFLAWHLRPGWPGKAKLWGCVSSLTFCCFQVTCEAVTRCSELLFVQVSGATCAVDIIECDRVPLVQNVRWILWCT